jgi:hypothetical protein
MKRPYQKLDTQSNDCNRCPRRSDCASQTVRPRLCVSDCASQTVRLRLCVPDCASQSYTIESN